MRLKLLMVALAIPDFIEIVMGFVSAIWNVDDMQPIKHTYITLVVLK